MSNTRYKAIESAQYTLRCAGYNIHDAPYAALIIERARLERDIMEGRKVIEQMDTSLPEHLEDEASYDESMQPDDDSCTECGGDTRGHQWPYCECMPDIQDEQPEDSIEEEFYDDVSNGFFKGRDIHGNEGFFEDYEQSIGEA